jgi:Domain of unknown function (DUF4338)
MERNLRRYEPRLVTRLASGSDVDPEKIAPRLVEVQRGSEDELLFRYATLHWSIPVSSGYGRRLRFLVIDENNERLIGLFGLGDPVFNMGVRDRWIGWSADDRKARLHHVMDAFIVGAVPPYAQLLCGKLVAMLIASDEVRRAFSRRYGARQSLISQRPLDGRLVLVTTTSALGRSSIYNRVRYRGEPLLVQVGATEGYGEFHFANGLYSKIWEYAQEFCTPSERAIEWGKGFRNRREVIRKTLMSLGLSSEWAFHGVQRELFAIPLAANAPQILRGEHRRARWKALPAAMLFEEFRTRWLLPRAERDSAYQDFRREDYQLWQ